MRSREKQRGDRRAGCEWRASQFFPKRTNLRPCR